MIYQCSQAHQHPRCSNQSSLSSPSLTESGPDCVLATFRLLLSAVVVTGSFSQHGKFLTFIQCPSHPKMSRHLFDLSFFFFSTSHMSLQGGQQQWGANPGGWQQERSAAASLHTSQGGLGPGEEDLEMWLRGMLRQVQLACGSALQGTAWHRRGTRHAPEPHLHPSTGGATEESLHHHVTQRAPSSHTTPLTSGVERRWRKGLLSKWLEKYPVASCFTELIFHNEVY